MIASNPQKDYSTVTIRLRVEGRVIEVSEASEYYLILAETTSVPAKTPADLIMVIEGHECERQIFLHEGIASSSRYVTFL